MKKIKKYSIGILGVILSAIIAILVHALLPSPGATTNVEAFDGYLVELLGFPFVASMYFLLLYLHILIIIFNFGEKSIKSKVHTGLCYGIAFGLMYMVGMQEVMVEGSPLNIYGWDFIFYQFFMGLGDAIPVFALCMILVMCINKKNERNKKSNIVNGKILRVIVIGICFSVERTLRYYIGFIDSDIQQYPVQVLIWTVLMGFVFGIMNVLLESTYSEVNSRKRTIQINVLTIGINWIWFNCFIGLIMKGTFVRMILRGGIDVLFIAGGALIADFVVKRGLKE